MMLEHLLEIRRRLLFVLFFFIGFFCCFFLVSTQLFHILIQPLLTSLPVQSTIIATEITSPVLTPISIAANFALLSTAPFALFQIWLFVLPGLYSTERRLLQIVLVASMVLFLCGMIFCFYGVLPFMFQFFTASLPADVRLMPDMRHAVQFITRMLLLFGFSFQVPLVCFVLVRLQWLEVASLIRVRPYVIVAAFVLGMILTPPDVFSQISLALPLCLLYELGIWATKLVAIFSGKGSEQYKNSTH